MTASGNRASDRLKVVPPPRRDRALEAAIAATGIAIHFQPQVEPVTGFLTGVEALARWPLEPSSERLFARAAVAGLGERLSRHLQAAAIAIAARWTGPLATIRLSLNCVAADLARPSYGAWLVGECSRAGLDPRRLTLEITEESLVIDRALAAAKLGWLRQWGVRIAIDDFGTGYANLPYLTQLPLDILKLDRELIAGIASERGRIVVRSIIAMAHALGLEVCAEGIESEEQMALVAQWGCASAQGYLIAPGLADPALRDFAHRHEPVAA